MVLLFFDLVLLFVAVVAAGITAFATRSFSRSIGAFFGVLLVGILGYAWICFRSDPYVRDPIALESVTGTYTITDSDSQELLKQLGYLDFSGTITLNSDGTFSGSRIPFLCINWGPDAQNKSKVGYWDLSAKWNLAQDGGITAVEFSNFVAMMSGAHETGEWHPEFLPRLRATRGHPTGLAFSVFTSGDFYDVVFSRPGK